MIKTDSVLKDFHASLSVSFDLQFDDTHDGIIIMQILMP